MKFVQENLYEFTDAKFFNSLLEEEELSPADKKKLKLELEKQGMAVVKKCINNFSAFKKNAGDIWQEYRDFWSTQKNADESVQQKGNFYNLWESDYIVGVVKEPNGKGALKVFNTSASKDDYIAFSCKSENVLKAFNEFFKENLETTMKNVIKAQKDAMVAKKAADEQRVKDETVAKKKENLDAFLQESKINEEKIEKWMIYIPEEGHWPIKVDVDATYKEAKKEYLKTANRKKLPSGSRIEKAV